MQDEALSLSERKKIERYETFLIFSMFPTLLDLFALW